jgi:death-on-curing protein
MRYLTVSDVAAMNTVFVGEDKPFDFGRLESSVQRPQTTVGGVDAYPTIHEKAAALLNSIVRNHPFFDGNKRTALAAVVVFYRLNGYMLDLEQGDAVNLLLNIATRRVSVGSIAKALAGGARIDDREPT